MQEKCVFGDASPKTPFFFWKNCLISEVHFRKQHFGSSLPKYCAFCRFIKIVPLPHSFTLTQIKNKQRRKFVQTHFQGCIKAPITLLYNIQKPTNHSICKF